MTALETAKFALERDEKELDIISRDMVKIEKTDKVDGILARYRITVNLGDKNTYIIRKGSDTPEPVNKIAFYVDVPYTYPQCAVRVYFGTKQGLYHVNTWNDDNHRQCIDVWTKYSSIKSVIEKTLRAILYDEDVCRYESMANSLAKNWQQKKVREGEFPIYPSSILFRKRIDISKPSVKRTKSVKTNPRCCPVVRKVIA